MSNSVPHHLSLLFVVKGLDLGGLERVVTDLAVGMHQRGVNVEVALVNPSRDRLVPMLKSAGIPVRLLGGSDRVGLSAAWRLRTLVRSGRYAVVHAHGPLPTVVARLAAGASASPRIVTTFHTMWTALRSPSRWALCLTTARNATTVAVSGAVAESLPRRIAATAVVISHGIDLDACAEAMGRAPLLRRELAAPGEVLLVTVASHRAAKNYPNLLRAVAAARESGAAIHLLAVGEGEAIDAHRALVSALGLADHVTFEAPRLDVLDVIAAADIFVVASDYEGQPMVLVEAMATGRPIVATAVGRIPELITEQIGRLVPPNDCVALATALTELACDEALRTRLGAAALLAAQHHSIEDSVDAHLALYRRLVQR